MFSAHSSTFLRRVLILDAISAGGMGVLALLLADPIGALLNLPATFLSQIGWVLVPFAAFVGYVASRPTLSATAVWVIIGLNILWVIDSALVLLTGWVQPNAAGYAVVIAQALAVAVLTELEFMGVRRLAVVSA